MGLLFLLLLLLRSCPATLPRRLLWPMRGGSRLRWAGPPFVQAAAAGATCRAEAVARHRKEEEEEEKEDLSTFLEPLMISLTVSTAACCFERHERTSHLAAATLALGHGAACAKASGTAGTPIRLASAANLIGPLFLASQNGSCQLFCASPHKHHHPSARLCTTDRPTDRPTTD